MVCTDDTQVCFFNFSYTVGLRNEMKMEFFEVMTDYYCTANLIPHETPLPELPH